MQEQGSIIGYTLIIIMIVAMLAVSLLGIVKKQKITAVYYQENIENYYLIEAAVIKAKTEVREKLESEENNNWRRSALENFNHSGQLIVNQLLDEKQVIINYNLEKIRSENGKANINLLPPHRLRKLPEIGTSLSTRIYQKRIKQSFVANEELKSIQGVGEKKYEKLNSLLTSNDVKKININTATCDVLTTLEGIGITTASNIISYRQANGPFTKKNDLKNISGVGRVTYQNLVSEITTKSKLMQLKFSICSNDRDIETEVTELVRVEVE